ncbi:MAG: beta-hydroxyacyl-ACP dehydratase, partial [Oligosphaeraceae bacterium]|nr:beta-hydroxyacyl-ACP dehydratase [Oligosphaeraceae bacterium]
MGTCYSYAELAGLLGIKAPLLMLDRLEVLPESAEAHGRKMVSNNEFMFAGHFPGQPVMPGVLQVAAMAQAAKALLLQLAPQESGTAVLVSMEKVKFRKPVLPGMVLAIAVQSSGRDDQGRYQFQVKNSVEGELASSGNVSFKFFAEDYFRPLPASGKACPWQDSLQGEYC